MSQPRIVFFGYSEVGYQCLSLLLGRGDNVVALITHEDNPSTRKSGSKRPPSPRTRKASRSLRRYPSTTPSGASASPRCSPT